MAFSGDAEDATYTSKSQKNPFALSARIQTLIALLMGFLGMYCLTLDCPLKGIPHLINCVVAGWYEQHLELHLQKDGVNE